MEEVESLWGKLRLTADEDSEIRVPDEAAPNEDLVVSRCLVGKILTSKTYNKEAFKATMKLVWRIIQGVQIKEIGENIFLFEFVDSIDRQFVLSNGPWHFDRSLVILDVVSGAIQPSKISLSSITFWVQLHDLPLQAMTRETATLIGNQIGILEAVDVDDEHVCWGKFIRIRVTIDISKALRRGIKIRCSKKEACWVSFKYERLMDFCYWCGCLGHSFKECRGWIAHSQPPRGSSFQYGDWLRAGQTHRTSKRDFSTGGSAESENRHSNSASSSREANPMDIPLSKDFVVTDESGPDHIIQENHKLNPPSVTEIVKPVNVLSDTIMSAKEVHVQEISLMGIEIDKGKQSTPSLRLSPPGFNGKKNEVVSHSSHPTSSGWKRRARLTGKSSTPINVMTQVGRKRQGSPVLNSHSQKLKLSLDSQRIVEAGSSFDVAAKVVEQPRRGL